MTISEHAFTVTPVDATIDGAGLRIHYLDWGGDAKPDILFVHGFGLTAHTWDVVCDVTSDHAHCYAMDLRGHGDSDWSEDGTYPAEHHAADIEAVANGLGLESFVLVGHSLGGMASLRFAARNQDRLAGLVIVDTGPRVQPRRGSSRIRNFVAADGELDSIDEFVERAVAFNPLRDPERLRRSLLFNLKQTPTGKWTWKYDRRHLGSPPLSDEEFARAQASLRELGAAIDKPTLLIRGGESDAFSPEDAEAFASVLPQGRLVTVAGASHTVQGDQPYAFAEALRAFVDDLD